MIISKMQPSDDFTELTSSREWKNNGTLEQLVLEDSGKCVLCNKVAVCVCHRCKDFYCSPECQQKDWQKHRYICFTMPPLVLAASLRPHDHLMPHMGSNSSQHRMQGDGNRNQNLQQRSKMQSKLPGKPARDPIPMPSAIRSGSLVRLTGFRTANRCFLRSLTAEEDENYLRVMKQVDVWGKNSPELTKMPRLNSYAITQHDGSMHRVQIIAIRNELCARVLFCDIGTTGLRSLKELREISEEILALPQYSMQMQLYRVKSFTICNELMNYLYQYQDKNYQIRYVEEPDELGGKVELYFWNDRDKCLNKIINDFGNQMQTSVEIPAVKNNKEDNSTQQEKKKEEKKKEEKKKEAPTPPQQAKNKPKEQLRKNDGKESLQIESPSVTTPDAKEVTPEHPKPELPLPFETHHWAKGTQDILAIIMDNSCLDYGYLACIKMSDASHFTAVIKYLSKYQDSKIPYKPKQDEYCLAKFENEWFRAQVVEVADDDQFTVVYVDYLNENTLTSQDIRQYPSDLTADCRSQLCLINDLPPQLSPEQIKFLKKEAPAESQITIDLVKDILEDEVASVDCSSLIKKMRDSGLL